MRRPLVAVLLLLVLTACSASGIDIVPTEELPPDVYGDDSGQTPAVVILYMVEGNRLIRVGRTGEAPGTRAEVAVRALLAGPTTDELSQGIETKIPDGTELLSVNVADGLARVNLDIDFQVVEDPEDLQEYVLRVAQLVWTLDEIADVTQVQLLIQGQPSTVYDQFRREVNGPVARGRYSNLEPRSDRPVSEAPIRFG